MKLSNQTKEKLKNLSVAIIYLFGSRANGTALNKSDYDVGVVFFDSKKAPKIDSELFSSVYSALSDDLPDRLHGPKLDISFLQNANAALEMSAIDDGIVLFEADSVFRADYEEAVLKRYDDYLSLKREYEEATFSAFIR